MEIDRTRQTKSEEIPLCSRRALVPSNQIEQLLQDKHKEILRLAAQRGAYNVRVFGSVARGEAGPESDVDFLVNMEPGRSLFDLGGLLMDLRDLLGCNVDVVTEPGLRPRIRQRVLDEARPLWETSVSDCWIY